MVQSISTIASTPFCNLGTQTYTATVAGLYTMGFDVTIPWMTSDQAYARANPELAQIQTVTAVADSSGSLNNTWFKFYTAGNAYSFYVWFNINSAGSDPAPAGFTKGFEVDAATSATASTIGGDIRTVLQAATFTDGNGVTQNLSKYVVVTGATTDAILTNTQYGAVTAAADGTAAPGFSYAVGTTGTYGYASGLVLQVKKNTTLLLQQDNPAPTQPLMAGSTTTSLSIGDTFTLVLSSQAAVDQLPNAVKGIVNVYLGK